MIKTRLIGILSDAKKYIVRQVLWQFIALICQVVIVFCIAHMLEGILHGSLSCPGTALCAACIVIAIALRVLCNTRASRASYAASADVKRILREKIYEKILRLGAGWKERISAAEVTQLAGEGVEQLEIYFGKYLSQLIYSVTAPIALFIIISFISIPSAVILLIFVPLIPISIMLVQKIAKRLLSKYWGVYTKMGDGFLENMQGLTTLKIYGADGERAAKMDGEAEHFRKITMKVLTMQLNSTSVMDIMAYGGAAAGIIVALNRLFAGAIDIGGAIVIVLLAAEFFLPMRVLGSYFHIAMNGMAASDKMFALLDVPEPDEVSGCVPDGEVSISIKGLCFAYEEDRPILKDVSMGFKSGSMCAIVGKSGCGKSTVTGVLTGKNSGYKGSVMVSGMPLSKIKESSLMKNITLVSYSSHIFKGSIEENLKIANPDAHDTEMREALSRVNLLDFIDESGGLSMEIKENASNLSGGQRQRLALARALLHDSPVYIFDEATSNIDSESEEMIMNVIRDLAREKTVILISHRLANVTGASRIYMMKGGAAVDFGTHNELMRSSEDYRKLYDAQMRLEAYAGSTRGRGRREESDRRAETDGGRRQSDCAQNEGGAHP